MRDGLREVDPAMAAVIKALSDEETDKVLNYISYLPVPAKDLAPVLIGATRISSKGEYMSDENTSLVGAFTVHRTGPHCRCRRCTGRCDGTAQRCRRRHAAGDREAAARGFTAAAERRARGGGRRWLVGTDHRQCLKRYNPAFDVLLIDKQPAFVSFPLSNSWLADQIHLDFLSHSFFDAADNHKYHFLQATVLGVDRTSRKVYTDVGYIAYEYMVLAPGIDYDYGRIGVDDPGAAGAVVSTLPRWFRQYPELLTIKL